MAEWQDPALAGHYNRNYAFAPDEIRALLDRLRLSPDDTFVDFGCGNGAVVAAAASIVRRALGIDVAPAQVELARQAVAGLPNAEIRLGAFLDCPLGALPWASDQASVSGGPPAGEPDLLTRAFARKSLHHLTDAEKGRFFSRVGQQFAPGGLFLIEDGIFTFARHRLEEHMPEVLADAGNYYADRWPAVRDDVLHTLREEFPTGFDAWEAALRSGGFTVVDRWQKTCFYGGLLAERNRT